MIGNMLQSRWEVIPRVGKRRSKAAMQGFDYANWLKDNGLLLFYNRQFNQHRPLSIITPNAHSQTTSSVSVTDQTS